MEFRRVELPPARNKKGGMGSEDHLRNSFTKVQYLDQYQDLFEATQCYEFIWMDRFLSTNQSAKICRSITAVSVSEYHIFITYFGRRINVSNQFLRREFNAPITEQFLPCKVPSCNTNERGSGSIFATAGGVSLSSENLVWHHRQPRLSQVRWILYEMGTLEEWLSPHHSRAGVTRQGGNVRNNLSRLAVKSLSKGHDRSESLLHFPIVIGIYS